VHKYKSINTRTLTGLKKAERLKKQGWKIVSVGFETIIFEKESHEEDTSLYCQQQRHFRHEEEPESEPFRIGYNAEPTN